MCFVYVFPKQFWASRTSFIFDRRGEGLAVMSITVAEND